MAALPEYSLSILDVGHGNSAVLVQPEGVIIIDTGTGSALLEFLSQNGIKHVSTILISHADQDHIGGLVGLLSSGLFIFSDIFVNTDSHKTSVSWDALMYELDKLHSQGEINFNISLVAGAKLPPDLGRTHINVVSPTRYLAAKGPSSQDRQKRRITSNSISGVIQILRDDNPIALLCGDIDHIGLDGLIESGVNANGQYLVFPHHGGKPGASDLSEFSKRVFELVSPKVLIFSIGRGRYDTPDPIIITEAKNMIPDIIILCTQLSERCQSATSLKGQKFHTDFYSRGSENGKCCTGTIVIDLDRPDNFLPTHESHQSFITECIDTPICQREINH